MKFIRCTCRSDEWVMFLEAEGKHYQLRAFCLNCHALLSLYVTTKQVTHLDKEGVLCDPAQPVIDHELPPFTRRETHLEYYTRFEIGES